MDKLEQLMIITMEECGELIQVCSKVLRKRATQGKVPEETSDKLEAEVADVLCMIELMKENKFCLLYTSPSPRDLSTSRMPSSA